MKKHYLKSAPLISALFLLASCGFKPIYGSHGSGDAKVSEQLNQVAIDSIANRQGQIMRNELIDRMYGKGRPAQPAYHLIVKLRQTQEDLGIQADATSTRTLLNMYADYNLFDLKGKDVLHGTAHSISSFNTLVDEYGNLSALNAATGRTVSEDSEQIVNRLSLYFAEADEGYKPAPPPSPSAAQDQIPSASPDDFSTIRR